MICKAAAGQPISPQHSEPQHTKLTAGYSNLASSRQTPSVEAQAGLTPEKQTPRKRKLADVAHDDESVSANSSKKMGRTNALPMLRYLDNNSAAVTEVTKTPAFDPAMPPKFPNELALMVLKNADANPMQLMAFFRHKNREKDQSAFSCAAWDNASWAVFDPQEISKKTPKRDAFARRFLARYRALGPYGQKILSVLWLGTPDEKTQAIISARYHVQTHESFDTMLAAVNHDGLTLGSAHESLRRNKKIVFPAVRENGLALQYAHETLTGDRDIALAAVEQHAAAFRFLHPDLQNDRNFVLVAVSLNPYVLIYVRPHLQNDREIVLVAVKKDGLLLKFAHDNLKRDRDIARVAISKKLEAVQYVSSVLKNDPELKRLIEAASDTLRLQQLQLRFNLRENDEFSRKFWSSNGGAPDWVEIFATIHPQGDAGETT